MDFTKKTALFGLLVFLLPLFIQYDFDENWKLSGVNLGIPRVLSGDEPHYFIVLYSLVNDKDIFLENNYEQARLKKSCDLGELYRGRADRHTRFFDTVNRQVVNGVFVDKITGEYDNPLVLNKSRSAAEFREISGHAMGLPFFSAVFLWPLKNTCLLEPFALFLTAAFSLLGLAAFYAVLKQDFPDNKWLPWTFTGILAFATPYWHYSRTYWAEPYLTSLLIISWYLIRVKNHAFLPGLLLGFGGFMKYPFALITVILSAYWLLNKKFTKFIVTCAGIAVPLSLLLSLNIYLQGTPFWFTQSEAVVFGNYFYGVFHSLLNLKSGLLVFSPFLVFGIYGIIMHLEIRKKEKLLPASAAIAYFLFWAFYIVAQEGEGGHGPRHLVVITPILVWFTAHSYVNIGHGFLKKLFWVLVAVSAAISFQAAYFYPAFWGAPPWTLIQKLADIVAGIF